MSEPVDGEEHPSTRRHKAGHVFRAIAVDTTPLKRSPDFRRLWIGEVITMTGSAITAVTLLIQIAQITGGSAIAIGFIGAAEFVPLVVGTILGGPLIDRMDRRNLLLMTQVALAATTMVLLASAIAFHPPLWVLYLAAGASSFLVGIDIPARSALTPNLVGKDLLAQAVALNQVMWSVSTIIGPAIAGVVVARFGLGWAYGLDLATYAVSIVLTLGIRHAPPVRDEESAEMPKTWASIKEGVSFLRGKRVLKASFGIDLFAMIFGLPEALFPILAVTQFHSSPELVGGMLTAIAVGAFVGSISSGWIDRVKHQGKAVVWAVMVWGAGIIAFGLIGDHILIAFLLLAIAGGADVISAVFRGTILQDSVTDDLRGRLSGIHFLVVAGGPKLGYLEAGVVAALFNPMVSVVSGGIITILGAIGIALFVPEFWNYHAGDVKPPEKESVQ